MKIARRVAYDRTTILFDGAPQLIFAHREVVSVQTWRQEGCWSVELTFRAGAAVTCEYDTDTKFRRVIALIEEALTR